MAEAQPKVLIPAPTFADCEYNRTCWPQYAEAVKEAGGTPIEASLALSQREVRDVLKSCSGILLPGSPADVSPELYGHAREAACGKADPARERMDRLLLEYAFQRDLPVLGICYGMQSLNVYLGGTLLQDVPCWPLNHAAGPAVAVAHTAMVEGSSQFASLIDRAEAPAEEMTFRLATNSSHHQAVGLLGEGLRAVARSTQDDVIEAVEGYRSEKFLLGVQWHPERSTADSPTSRAIFERFIRAARDWEAPGSLAPLVGRSA